jgi:ABC-type amino acid transport substrate-binding protein
MSVCLAKINAAASVSRLSMGLLLCAAVGIAYGNNNLSKIRDTKTITIAYRDASLPFSFLDGDKKPIGYAIDLCLKIADAVKSQLKLSQLNIVYLPVTSDNRMQMIADGKADIECGSTANTAARRKLVDFTIPHFVTAARMLVRTDSGIKNWPDLRNKKVVATKGTVNMQTLNERGQVRSLNLTTLEGRDHNDSFHMLETRAADAFATDDVLLYGLRATAKDPSAYAVVGDPLSTSAYAIMMRKDDAEFKAVVDREMARIIQDGEIYKIYAKWFLNPISAKNNMNMNMPMNFLLKDSFQYPSDKVSD